MEIRVAQCDGESSMNLAIMNTRRRTPGKPSEGWIYLHFAGGPQGGSQVAKLNLSWPLEDEPTGDGSIPKDLSE